MTLKQKGPVDNTPARPGPSTGEQCDDICDECFEHLGRIADEAQNFGIPSFAGVFDYRSSPEWRTCCRRAEELVREGADTIRNYGERVRDILRDKIAMEKLLANDWPAFERQLRRLFPAIHEIYNSAGISPTLPIQRMGGQILYGSDGLEHDIQRRMDRHRKEIRRAPKIPLEEFYAWRTKERRADASVESESKLPGTPSRRGPLPDMDLHRAIARIVTPYGSNWKNESNLEKIAEQLDKNPLTPPPKQWAERKPPARSWSRAVRHYPEVVVKRISYSLKMARRNPH